MLKRVLRLIVIKMVNILPHRLIMFFHNVFEESIKSEELDEDRSILSQQFAKDDDINNSNKNDLSENIYRYDIINKIIKKKDFKNYLEIGVRNPSKCFDKIEIKNKWGVDPGVENEENPVDYKMTSDEFFYFLDSNNSEIKYDIIFIDGLHLSYQVKNDIINSLRYINQNGFVILHDCNPPDIIMAREDYSINGVNENWNGTVWKAIYWAKTHRKDLRICTVDTDWGIGIIQPNHKNDTKLIKFKNPFYEFNIMDSNRNEDLGLLKVNDLDSWLEN